MVTLAYAPHTEADPAGILLTLLALAGNAANVKPRVHIVAGHSHRLALQTVLVGDTAYARKSTGITVAKSLAKRAADAPWRTRFRSTFTSAEAIVAEVADPVEDTETKGMDGSTDKRLVICVPEMATQIEAALRPQSAIFQTLRLAWDGDSLAAISRRSKLMAEEHHITLVGAITRSELRSRLPQAEAAAGTVNRMLFCRVSRTQELPFGGTISDDEEADLVRILHRAIEQARPLGVIRYDDEVREWWGNPKTGRYHEIVSRNGSDPLAAHFAREDVMIVRVAATFAALDGSHWITMAHMNAAQAIWDHSVETVRWVWGDPTQDRPVRNLLKVVMDTVPPGIGRYEAAEMLGRPKAESLTAWIEALTDADLICTHTKITGTRGARPLILYPFRQCGFPTEHLGPPVDLNHLAERARQR
jgi:hypothetical protein